MAPPPSTAVSPLVALIVRILTFVCLLVSLIIIATNNSNVEGVEVKFDTFYAYRYMLATTVIGMAYTLLQTAFTMYFASTGTRFGGDGFALVEFYGDKVFSYMLATGAAAGFGLSVDLNRGGSTDYLNKANAAAALLFFGFIFSAISSIFSSLSLPKRT